MISPPFLKKGDKIGIVASARKIGKAELEPSLEIIRSNGFDVVYSSNIFSEDNQFAGSDKIRANELQQMLDNKEIKAIIFARGGYGSVRIIDTLDFSRFISNPKWLIGYSDATVFHSHVLRNYDIQTLHASMPVNFQENTKLALESLFDFLYGRLLQYEFKSHPINKTGIAEGILTGGNLSVLYSLLGSNSFPDTEGKILFLEDLDEYLYHIDRMMMGLKRAGVLSNLAGLLIGGMTDMNDNTIPFGKTAEEIIRETVDKYNYPVYFGFPAGHMNDNRALVMGREAKIIPKEKDTVSFVTL
ncbi:MAG TPA: LD-carboxypeptidase [Bacteroidales bacterium]|jgi:muramoyltetrapeptide carboxypeptidase|nr:LD-carboxypeptidase [Bacteroidota bacterium]HJN05099.1 LD-carboxypeptidase [Bacteroidales bacterium]|tara:strand:- start:559 stop:1461 length:903 start_codon:yes stop_codon:yes gene_type:complete